MQSMKGGWHPQLSRLHRRQCSHFHRVWSENFLSRWAVRTKSRLRGVSESQSSCIYHSIIAHKRNRDLGKRNAVTHGKEIKEGATYLQGLPYPLPPRTEGWYVWHNTKHALSTSVGVNALVIESYEILRCLPVHGFCFHLSEPHPQTGCEVLSW
jgi:hypothetical protein